MTPITHQMYIYLKKNHEKQYHIMSCEARMPSYLHVKFFFLYVTQKTQWSWKPPAPAGSVGVRALQQRSTRRRSSTCTRQVGPTVDANGDSRITGANFEADLAGDGGTGKSTTGRQALHGPQRGRGVLVIRVTVSCGFEHCRDRGQCWRRSRKIADKIMAFPAETGPGADVSIGVVRG
jgi:hypothetical protein